MADTRYRMLQLLSVLQGGRSFSGTDLAARLDTSARTLRRDIDRLRELGYPVQTMRGPGGHYRLTAGSAMPPLLLDDDEAVAITVGLQLASAGAMSGIAETAASALRKVEQVLPRRLRHRVRAMRAATETKPDDWPQVTAELLRTVGEAAHERRRLAFDYTDRAGRLSRRRVEPYRQVLVKRRWYMLAWDLDREDWRVFRLDRAGAATLDRVRFDPRPLPAADASSYIEKTLWSHPARHHVIVEFHAPIERVATLLPDRDGSLEELDAQHCRYTTDVDSYEWLAITLGILGLDYRIVAPEGFIAYSRDLAARVAASTDEQEQRRC